MKVLILSITTGQGHHQCAMALMEYLKKQNVECKMTDALQFINPILGESVSHGYLLSTHYSPTTYGKIYRLAEKKGKPTSKVSISHLTLKILSMKLKSHIEEYDPDVIVCTHVYASELVSVLHNLRAKTIGIITDFTVHPFWEDTNLDYYVLANDLLKNQAYKKGINENKLICTGIPIHEKFSKKIDKSIARSQLGFDDKTTVFIMSGSMGYGNLVKHIKKLDKLELDFQIVCVCGKNTHIKNSIDKLSLNKKIYNFGYVDNVDIIIDASDYMITKPGGLSVSEGLAKGIPMILMNPIPGQEDRNSEFLLNNGVAMLMSSTFPVDECIYQFMSNNGRMISLNDAIVNIGKPNATKNLGDFIIETINS